MWVWHPETSSHHSVNWMCPFIHHPPGTSCVFSSIQIISFLFFFSSSFFFFIRRIFFLEFEPALLSCLIFLLPGHFRGNCWNVQIRFAFPSRFFHCVQLCSSSLFLDSGRIPEFSFPAQWFSLGLLHSLLTSHAQTVPVCCHKWHCTLAMSWASVSHSSLRMASAHSLVTRSAGCGHCPWHSAHVPWLLSSLWTSCHLTVLELTLPAATWAWALFIGFTPSCSEISCVLALGVERWEAFAHVEHSSESKPVLFSSLVCLPLFLIYVLHKPMSCQISPYPVLVHMLKANPALCTYFCWIPSCDLGPMLLPIKAFCILMNPFIILTIFPNFMWPAYLLMRFFSVSSLTRWSKMLKKKKNQDPEMSSLVYHLRSSSWF